MKICKKCLLPQNFPRADIDDTGLCAYCRKGITLPDYSHEEGGFKALVREVESGKRRKPNCLVSYSGGKDSTYALILAKEKYGLSPAVFTLDNGYVSQRARENIEKICDGLGAELITVRPDPEKMNAVFAATLRHKIFARNVVLRVSSVCYACITFVNYQAIQLALEKGLRIIISGFTHGQVPKAVFPIKAAFIMATYDNMKKLLREKLDFDVDEFYPKVDYSKLDSVSALYSVNPLLFEKYDEKKIISTIKKYGWEKPKDTDSCSSNCLMNKVGNYYHYRDYGYHPYQYEISSLVRIGAMSKKEGEEILSDTAIDRGARDIIKKLKLEA